MTAHVRKLPVTYEHDGQELIGGLQLPAGEYYGYAEEQGLELAGEVEWGHAIYHLVFDDVDADVSADVVHGRITVRAVDMDTILNS